MNNRKRSAEQSLDKGIDSRSHLRRKIDSLEQNIEIADRYIDDLKSERDYLQKKNRQLSALNNLLETTLSTIKLENKELMAKRKQDEETILFLESHVMALTRQIEYLQSQPSFQNTTSSSSPLSHTSYSILDIYNKTLMKIFSRLPGPLSSNPIAALINFSNHQIHAEINFCHTEFKRDSLEMFKTDVLFDKVLLCSAEATTKKKSKEIAAKWALLRINQERELLENLILRFRTDRNTFVLPNVPLHESLWNSFEVNGESHHVDENILKDYLYRYASSANAPAAQSYPLDRDLTQTTAPASVETPIEAALAQEENVAIPVKRCASPTRPAYPQDGFWSPTRAKAEDGANPEQNMGKSLGI